MNDSTAGVGPAVPGYDGWAVLDLEALTVVSVNPAALVALGAENEELPQDLARFVADDDVEFVLDEVLPIVRAGNMWSGVLQLRRPNADAETFPAVVVPQLEPGSPDVRHASVLLALQPAAAWDDLVMDPLTGLPTRAALFPRLESAVQANRTNSSLLVALFIDLDGLKTINDRYGHEVGDTALSEAAGRILGCLSPPALAVRFGGDEFVVIHDAVVDLDEGEELAADILAALDRTDGQSAISASIGLAVCRNGEVTADELIRRADTAMYRAKARGGSQVAIFDAEMHERRRAAETLRAGLLESIADKGFAVAAQPIFELATGNILTVELFVRVRDNSPYIAEADQLFRLAHDFGESLDAALLERAVVLARRWQTTLGPQTPRVQVNISARSLASSAFSGRFHRAARGADVLPSSIGFGIDCRDLASGADREHTTIAELRSIGASIVVDGFGGNDLSLLELAELRPAMVKLDAEHHTGAVLAGLVRATSSVSVPTCVKGLVDADALDQAVRIGAFAGQGRALTPVRAIEQVNAQLHDSHRIGF